MARANKLGETINQLGEIRAKITALNKQVDELTRQKNELEKELIVLLQDNGMKRASSFQYSVTVTEEVAPSVTDWDALHRYIVEQDMPYLLQRRASVKPFRELFEAGETIPGVEPYTYPKLSFKTL